MDVPYNHGKTQHNGLFDRCVASRVDGSASYWKLYRGYARRSVHHVIYARDGRYIKAGTEQSALKKLAAL